MILDQYKQTFWRMQSIILLVSAAIWVISGSRSLAGLFFTVMQVSSLIGASWGTRLKNKVDRDPRAYVSRA
jgi:hypothetical protein